jgi:hypothetical protein
MRSPQTIGSKCDYFPIDKYNSHCRLEAALQLGTNELKVNHCVVVFWPQETPEAKDNAKAISCLEHYLLYHHLVFFASTLAEADTTLLTVQISKSIFNNCLFISDETEQKRHLLLLPVSLVPVNQASRLEKQSDPCRQMKERSYRAIVTHNVSRLVQLCQNLLREHLSEFDTHLIYFMQLSDTK